MLQAKLAGSRRDQHKIMTSKIVSSRNPHPFPRIQNDEDFYGPSATKYDPYDKPTHLAQKEDPWNRLNCTVTLAASRREIFHSDPHAPRDSLDFVLKAKYNHHDEFLRAKHETLYQPETLGEEHGRVLKNRTKEIIIPPPPMNYPLKIQDEKKKESIHSIKNAIGQ
ncbi:hypothetical protein ACJMK2_015953 [Sinanodonta woodiana]|uniref:Uncharacterized protein n=1 Tax=Sinanodonta woodiana TaxID=1069815 RepID=A0ABD3US19_SINWO